MDKWTYAYDIIYAKMFEQSCRVHIRWAQGWKQLFLAMANFLIVRTLDRLEVILKSIATIFDSKLVFLIIRLQ